MDDLQNPLCSSSMNVNVQVSCTSFVRIYVMRKPSNLHKAATSAVWPEVAYIDCITYIKGLLNQSINQTYSKHV